MAISTHLWILHGFTSRIATGVATACLASLLLLSAPVAQAAGPVLKSQGPCKLNSLDVCLNFYQKNLPPKVLRALDFNAPSAGQAFVTAMGTGVCKNSSDVSTQTVRIATQIVNNPNAVATYAGPGGNRFRFTLPAWSNDREGAGVFNLASERLFAISGAGLQHYSLNISVPAIDYLVDCYVDSVALSVLFIPK